MTQTASNIASATCSKIRVSRVVRKRFYFLIEEFKRNGGTMTYLEDKGFFESNFYNARISGPKEVVTAFLQATSAIR